MGETNLNTSQKQQGRKSIVVIVGFMIFAQFFGAGNLIFPPFLGFVGGSKWIIGFIFFFIFDAVFGIMGLAASTKFPKVEIGAYYRPGRKFMLIFAAIGVFITVGFVVTPRAALTSYEVFLRPILAGGFDKLEPQTGIQAAAIVFLLVYMGLATLCAIRPTKVVDIMGKFLTPVLLVILVVVVIVGLATMSSTGVRDEAYATSSPSLVAFGVAQGLQTFDGPTGTLIAIIIIVNLVSKGITKSSEQTKSIIKSGFVAAICLAVIYLGLGLLGAFYSNDETLMTMFQENGGIDQTFLLNYILSKTLGLGGTIIFGLAILLATFTTSLGCLSLGAEFYRSMSGDKIKYKQGVFAFAILAFIVGLICSTAPSGVQVLLNWALPFLLVSAPITISLIILNMFNNQIKNDNVYRGAAIAAGIWGFASGLAYFLAFTIGDGALDAMNVYGSGWYASFFFGKWNVIYAWTGDLGYIIPAAVGAIIGAFVKKWGYAERPYLREHAGDEDFDWAALQAKKAAAAAGPAQ
jgi:LIVCS family branched-chain amino acid:cation transporter